MLKLSLSDWLILIGLALCIMSAVRSIRNRRNQGGGCSSCRGCPQAGSCQQEKSERK